MASSRPLDESCDDEYTPTFRHSRVQCSIHCANSCFVEKYKDSYERRYREMLTMIPALRYLSIWHNDLMAFAKTFGPITDRSKSKGTSVSSASDDQNTAYEHSVTMIRQLQI